MYSKDIILNTLGSADHIIKAYIGDLSDAEWMMRPVPGMNPIAWQVGHLISVEHKVINELVPGSSPSLPAGFDEMHAKETTTIDDPSKFLKKDEYLKLWDAQCAATKKALDSLDEAALQKTPADTFGGMCPTVGHKINFMGLHTMMHLGQFVAVRRKAGKPVVI